MNITNQSTINKIRGSQAVAQNRTRIFGYHGGTPRMDMEPRSSGLTCNPITGQTLLPFYPGKAGYVGAADSLTGERKILHADQMPGDYAYLVDRRFHWNDDYGFRLLLMLTNVPNGIRTEWSEQLQRNVDVAYDAAYDYFNVVHPELTECPFGLFKEMQLTDAGVGVSTPVWQPCPTCRLADLEDAELWRFRQSVAAKQGLDVDVLSKLRAALIDANQATIAKVSQRASDVTGEINNRKSGQPTGKTGRNRVDEIHLQMLHQHIDKEVTAVERLASAIVGTQQQVAPPLSADDRAELEEYRRKRQEASERMQKAREAKNKEAENEVPVN